MYLGLRDEHVLRTRPVDEECRIHLDWFSCNHSECPVKKVNDLKPSDESVMSRMLHES